MLAERPARLLGAISQNMAVKKANIEMTAETADSRIHSLRPLASVCEGGAP